MKQQMIVHAVLAGVVLCGLAAAQTQPQGNGRQLESARVLAGVREYPEVMVDAMVTLARHPDWLEKVVKKAQSGQDLKTVDPTMPENVRNAVRALADFPEAILLADARKEEMALLRDVRVEAPQGADVRTKQLRTDYAAGRREGALRWQEALQGQNEAIDAYRDLLTRFCKEMRTRVPNYACVEVTDRNYYFVLPPDESIMGFAQQEKANENLWRMMTSWWERYGMDRVDQLAIEGRGMPSSRAENALIDSSVDSRKSMWKSSDGNASGPVGLVPVALQPLADQPEEARLAFAVAEHERLWMPPQDSNQPNEPNQPQAPAIAGQPQAGMSNAMAIDDLSDDAQVQVEPPMDEQQPGVIVTPARPEMVIPPNAPATRDEPIVIAGDDDDDMIVYGGLDDDDVVELGPDAVEVGSDPLIVESSPTVVYESPTVVVPGPTYYPSYYTWGNPYYPTFSSFGFSFGYTNFGRSYPWYYPYSYYRPYGRTYSYYPRFCNDRIYYGGHRGIVLNGNYSDGRAIFSSGRRTSYYGGRDFDRDRFIFRRDGSGYGAVSALSQGQRFGDEVGRRTRSNSSRIGGLSDRIGGAGDRLGTINRSNDRDGLGRGTVRSNDGNGDRPRVVRRNGDGTVRSLFGSNNGQSGGANAGSSSARQPRSLRGVAPQDRSGGNPGTIRSLRPSGSGGNAGREAIRGFKSSRSSIGSGNSGARSSGNPGIRSFRGSSSQGARSSGGSGGSRQIIRREGKRP